MMVVHVVTTTIRMTTAMMMIKMTTIMMTMMMTKAMIMMIKMTMTTKSVN